MPFELRTYTAPVPRAVCGASADGNHPHDADRLAVDLAHLGDEGRQTIDLVAKHGAEMRLEIPGSVSCTTTAPHPTSCREGQFDAPLGIASDGRGNVYVADAGNARIQRFIDTGAYVGQWGQHGIEPGQFARPSGVATDAQGNVYVADTDNSRIQKFDPSGRLLDGFDVPATGGGSSPTSGSSRPRDVAVAANGDVYTLDDHPGRWGSVYVYRQAGSSMTSASVAFKRLRYRRGRIAVTVSCGASTTCRGSVRIAKGKATIAKRSYAIGADKRATIRLKPTRRGRAALMRTRKHRVTVRLQQDGTTVARRSLTLRR